MAYVPTVWVDDDGSNQVGTEFTADKMNKIEQGIAAAGTSGGGGHEILDEGAALPARARLNFVGTGVTASDDVVNGRTVVTVPSNATVPIDPWHVIGNSGEPAFQNSWGVVGGLPGLMFRKDPLGRVWIYGVVQGGASGAVIFTLPSGYRPITNPSYFDTLLASGAAGGYISIAASTGQVTAAYPAGGQVFVDVTFDTGTVTAMPVGPKGDTGGNATVPMEGWHTVGAAGEPAYVAPWTGTIRFRKDPLGKVIFDGSCTGGATNTTAFTLPAGYRPDATGFYDCLQGGGGAAYVQITNGGAFVPQVGAAGVWVSGLILETGTVVAMPTGPQGPKGDIGGTMDAAVGKQSAIGAAVDVAGAWRALPLGPLLSEPSDAFTVAANAITVKDAGWYHVSVTSLNGQGATNVHFLAVSTSAVAGDGDIANSSGATLYTRANASGSVKLPAGGKVYIYAWSNAAPPVNVYVQSLSIERIGGPRGVKGDPGGVTVTKTMDWNLAIQPGFYYGGQFLDGTKTLHGVGDQLNPPDQAGIVSANPGVFGASLVQRVWDLSVQRGYTRYMAADGSFSAWVAEYTNPAVATDLSAGGPTPQEGDERYFQNAAMKAAGIMWKFRFDKTAPAGKPPWLYVGGPGIHETHDGDNFATPAGVWVDAGPAGPSVTAPLQGDYTVEFGGLIYSNVPAVYAQIGVMVGGVIDPRPMIHGNFGGGYTDYEDQSKVNRIDNVGAGALVKLSYNSNPLGGGYQRRWIRLTPIRVYL